MLVPVREVSQPVLLLMEEIARVVDYDGTDLRLRRGVSRGAECVYSSPCAHHRAVVSSVWKSRGSHESDEAVGTCWVVSHQQVIEIA